MEEAYNFGPYSTPDEYGSYLDDYYGGLGSDTSYDITYGDDNYGPFASGDEYGSYLDNDDSGDSWWSGVGDWASKNPNTILGVGLAGFQAWQKSEQQKFDRERAEEKERLAREDQKFKALIELAKLKYGPKPGGSGGGSASRRNELMIQALQNGSSNKINALNALAQNYGSAVTRNK